MTSEAFTLVIDQLNRLLDVHNLKLTGKKYNKIAQNSPKNILVFMFFSKMIKSLYNDLKQVPNTISESELFSVSS